MNISDKLTEEKLLEILETFYKKGQEKENIKMVDFLEDLKQKVLSVISTNI